VVAREYGRLSLPRNASLNCTMPELTNSSVGSFAGTSELEATMVWPLERKYSRKLERISFDFTTRFYCSRGKSRGAADTPETTL
jgi:hypothetical protein